MSSKTKSLIIVLVVFIMSFIGLYAGHFLFDTPDTGKEPEYPAEPVEYRHISTVINGNKQEFNILEVDPRSNAAMIKPVLSHDSVFGFEKLSSMMMRSNAHAAVNAGFFYEYGQPSGMVVIDGKLITDTTSRFPVFIFDGQSAVLRELDTMLLLLYNGRQLKLSGINTSGKSGDFIIYTNEYGSSNRVETGNTSFVIEKGIITRITTGSGSTDIPPKGMVLTVFGKEGDVPHQIVLGEGDSVNFVYEPNLGRNAQAYECGSWIVRDGKIMIMERDPWIGVTTNRDPRTAVGIKDDGKVVFLTVDGRQPGYSAGLTGVELGEYLLGYGVQNAAMLDGGASTEMIVEGQMVNRPSFRGQERLLGGAIIIKVGT